MSTADASPSAPAQGRAGRPLLPALAILLGIVLVAGVFAFWLLRSPQAVPRPVVLIGSPAAGQRVEVGQPVPIYATARGEQRIVRVELWVDGLLDQVQASSLSEGTSPLPLATWWQPATPGPHTLIARAFNAAGGRAHATLSMEAVESDDGPAGDTGSPPVEPGSPSAGGIPEAGADGSPDADTSPAEPQPAGSGGGPDGDADGIRDEADLCPGEVGLPWNAGCPETGSADRDGDGLADDIDLAPDEPGLPEHGGAPPPGEGSDLDGDTIPDDEEAPALLSPLGRLRARLWGTLAPRPKALTLVELEALQFAARGEYDEIVCYACLGDGPAERIGPLRPLAVNRWDVNGALGGANSWIIAVPDDQPLELRLECGGYQTVAHSDSADGGTGEGMGEAYFDLGTVIASHPPEEWDGRLQQRIASRPGLGSASYTFEYRLCRDTCGEPELPAPVAWMVRASGSDYALLQWLWEGDPETLDGFLVHYECEGETGETFIVPKSDHAFNVTPYKPRCSDTCAWEVRAYRGGEDNLLSPRSNRVLWAAEPCPGWMRVELHYLNGYDGAQGINPVCGRGPIYGAFWANGEWLYFNAAPSRRHELGARSGFFIPEAGEQGDCRFSLSEIFAYARYGQWRCPTCGYDAPPSTDVYLSLGWDEDLTVGYRIMEQQQGSPDPIVIEGRGTIPASYLIDENNNRELSPFEGTGAQCSGNRCEVLGNQSDLSLLLQWVYRPDPPSSER